MKQRTFLCLKVRILDRVRGLAEKAENGRLLSKTLISLLVARGLHVTLEQSGNRLQNQEEMKFKYLTAPLYTGLISSEILQLDIQEAKATCNSCLMSKSPTPREKRYEAHLKCCTFYPFVPNFAIGAVLSDTTGRYLHAQKVLREHIADRQYALPIGMVAPLNYQLEFKARKPYEFGNREDWLCPYFHREKNQCSMWAYRGAVCTSFYCKSSFGRAGLKFWDQMSDYLTYVEMALLEEALIRLDFSPRQLSDNLAYVNREERFKGEGRGWRLSEKVAKTLWRDYDSDQEGFYIKCFEIVSAFDKRAFREMMGEQGAQLEEKLLKAAGALR